MNKKSLYSRVPGCQITTYYYVGFAYMMMRRYADAIRTFTNILLYVQRTKTMFQTKSYQNDQINKQTEQMFVLLAICLVLHPQRIDESLHSTLREKSYAEKINKMQRGELSEFESCFAFSCPKFLSPVPPNYDAVNFDADAQHKEPLKLQLKVFMEEVQQQLMLPTIRSYLKLYTTMPLDKMAGFMEMPPEEFRNHLLAFKHKMQNVVWTKVRLGKGSIDRRHVTSRVWLVRWNVFCVDCTSSISIVYYCRELLGWRESFSLGQRWISTLTVT